MIIEIIEIIEIKLTVLETHLHRRYKARPREGIRRVDGLMELMKRILRILSCYQSGQ